MHTKYLFVALTALALLALAGSVSAAASTVATPAGQDGDPPAPLAASAGAIVAGPHMQNVAKTSADILWEANGTPTYLRYRLQGTATWTQYTVTCSSVQSKYICKQTLTGLTSNKKYEYQVSPNGATWTPSTPALFQTAPGASAGYVVVDWGDSQPTIEGGYPPDTAKFQTLVTKMKLQAPRMGLSTGDREERGLCYEDWKPDYFDPASSLIQNTAVFPGFGNHENTVRTANCATNTQRLWYEDYFTWPGKAAGKRWYAFTFGCVRYIHLDTTVDFADGSAQHEWLETELKSSAFTNAKWQVVFMHHPPYTCTDPPDSDAKRQQIHSQLEPLFELDGVDLVLSGHRHNYEYSLKNGVTYIVSGGGGQIYRNDGVTLEDPFEETTAGACKAGYNAYSVRRPEPIRYNFITLKVTCADPSSLVVKAVDVNGVVFDTVTLSPGAPPDEVCKSFQNGVQPAASYAKSTDTYIHENNPTTAYGALASVNVDGDDPKNTNKDVNGLFRWVIKDDVPVGSTVASAKIDFWVSNHSTGQAYELYKVKTSWTESVTWSSKPSWDTVVLGSMAPTTAPASFTVNLNAAGVGVVQGWVNTPTSNKGLVIRDSANSDGFDVDSSEGATKAQRPRLTVCYNASTAAAVAGLSELESDEEIDEAVDAAEFGALYGDVWNLSGTTYQGLGDASAPLAGVAVSLYGRTVDQEAPGVVLASAVSDGGGVFSLDIPGAGAYDFFLLEAQPRSGLVGVGIWSEEAVQMGEASVEWFRPGPIADAGEFHFDLPITPEPSQTEEPDAHGGHPHIWLPVIRN